MDSHDHAVSVRCNQVGGIDVTKYRIDIQPTQRFIMATVSGDFPGADEARKWWQSVADAAKARGLRRLLFVRYGGRPPDAMGIVDTLRNFQLLDLRDWRIAIVFWDAERLVEEYQFVSALARSLGFDLVVCDTIAEAEAFLDAPSMEASVSEHAYRTATTTEQAPVRAPSRKH